jgi:Fur family ferric uptake transcriptional regulator
MERNERNQQLSDQFFKVLQQLEQELVVEDEKVVNSFFETDDHLSEADLHHILSKDGIAMANVRRTLRLLCDLGVAQRIRLDGQAVYEHRHLDDHHDHLVCVRCGDIVEFVDDDLEASQRKTCIRMGFTPLMHKLEVRGICSQCATDMPGTRKLGSCLKGEEVVVVEVLGGDALKRRLLDLGLVRGTPLTVLSADGTMTLGVRGSRVALGHGEAAKVIVTLLGNDQDKEAAI